MARSPSRRKKVYWDACTWIAQISNQKVPMPDGSIENRGMMARIVTSEAETDKTEIFTSTFSFAEVCKLPNDPPDAIDKIKEFFENDFIVPVQLDRRTAEMARDLMQKGYPGLKPPDAVHLASASVANVEEMHTFDGKLLELDGKITKIDGTSLKICRPSMGGPPLELWEVATEDEENVEDGAGEPEASPSREEDDTYEIRLTWEVLEALGAMAWRAEVPSSTQKTME